MSDFLDESGKPIEPEDNMTIGTGDLEPLPAGLKTVSVIHEAKWDKTRNDDDFISVQWRVMQPEKFKGRVVFEKIWITDLDPNAFDMNNVNRNSEEDKVRALKKRTKARATYGAIDKNCGGKLWGLGTEVKNTDLARHWNSKVMNVTFQQYKFKDSQTGDWIVGNWVGAIGPRNDEEVANQVLPTQPRKPEGGFTRVMDDTIPF